MLTQDFLYQVFRKCGQMRPGYTNNPELLNDGLLEWQAMYDGWNAERTLNFSVPDYIYPIGGAQYLQGIYGPNIQFSVGPPFTFTGVTTLGSPVLGPFFSATNGLVIGQPISGAGIPAGSYITAINFEGGQYNTVAISQNATATSVSTIFTVSPSFNGPRPSSIVRMNLILTSSGGQPVRIPLALISAEEFSRIAVLQIPAISVTNACYYDPQFPQGILNIWPPLNSNSLEIFTWGELRPPLTLSEPFFAPPGYHDAIVYTLAERLYYLCTNDVMIHKVPYVELKIRGKMARDRIRRVNRPIPRLRSDFPSKGGVEGYYDQNVTWTGEPY